MTYPGKKFFGWGGFISHPTDVLIMSTLHTPFFLFGRGGESTLSRKEKHDNPPKDTRQDTTPMRLLRNTHHRDMDTHHTEPDSFFLRHLSQPHAKHHHNTKMHLVRRRSHHDPTPLPSHPQPRRIHPSQAHPPLPPINPTRDISRAFLQPIT